MFANLTGIIKNIKMLVQAAWVIDLGEAGTSCDVLNEALCLCTRRVVMRIKPKAWVRRGDAIYFRLGRIILAGGTVEKVRHGNAVIKISSIARWEHELKVQDLSAMLPGQEWNSWSRVKDHKKFSGIYWKNYTSV